VNPAKDAAQPSRLVRVAKVLPGAKTLYDWLTEKHSQVLPPPPYPGAVALELGCARGDFLRQLRSAGWIARGIELMAAPAQMALEAGLDVHHGTLESAQLRDGTMDAVFAWMVLEHLADPVDTLQEWLRILKPDGRLYLSVPNYGCWERKLFRSAWHDLDLPRHWQHFTPGTLRRLAEMTGFRLVKVLHQNSCIGLLGSLGIWLRRFRLTRRFGERCLRFVQRPTQGLQLALAPVTKLLAAMHQSGRLTCVLAPSGSRREE
jgi:SAM-dependent methyltransferase